jgi:hypothetical protein
LVLVGVALELGQLISHALLDVPFSDLDRCDDLSQTALDPDSILRVSCGFSMHLSLTHVRH